jgi:hypothetical protein
MARVATEELRNPPNAGEIGDLDAAAATRRRAEWRLPMSERLARVHALSRQMSAIKGAAQAR